MTQEQLDLIHNEQVFSPTPAEPEPVGWGTITVAGFAAAGLIVLTWSGVMFG